MKWNARSAGLLVLGLCLSAVTASYGQNNPDLKLIFGISCLGLGLIILGLGDSILDCESSLCAFSL